MASKKLKSTIALLAVLALTFPLAACGKQTTLDRVGAVLRTAAIGYQTQIEQLKNQGAISEERYNSLKRRADAIVQQSDAFANLIAGFGEIAPGDVPRILLQSALFPPKPSPTPAPSGVKPSAAAPVKAIKTNKIKVDLPAV